MTGAACIFLAIAVAWIAVLYADLRKTVDRLDAESWKRRYEECLSQLKFAQAERLFAKRQFHQLLSDLAKPIKPFTGRKKR
jgi:hypothetical protein